MQSGQAEHFGRAISQRVATVNREPMERKHKDRFYESM
jgi:hypothetical protein